MNLNNNPVITYTVDKTSNSSLYISIQNGEVIDKFAEFVNPQKHIPEKVQEVLRIIKEISEERITSIIVTHELEFALDVADKVIFFDEGEIVEQGKAVEVLKNPKDDRTIKFLGHFADKLDYVI